MARDGERAWYFLSPLRTKSPRGRRKARTVAGGTGWWHGEAGPKPVLDPLDGRRKVGYRQSFSFMRRGADGAPVRTGWIMVELRLHDEDDGDGAGGIGDQLEGLVLCKVYRSPRHPGHAEAPDGDDLEESCAAAAAPAPAGRLSNVAEDDGSSDSPVVTAAPPGGKRKADDDGEPSAATPRRHIRTADDETSGADVVTVLGPKEKTADDENETSGATTAAARGDEEEKKAADDEDSSASTPARKRAKTADDEGVGAASAPKRMAGAPATQQLHCPQCGFHLGALQTLVSPAKSTSETETETGIGQADETQGGGRTGDLPAKDSSFRHFF
ncbi:hypothetical protein GQ55_2G013300 [Panicum hallii var. hallii]|uniref:NAC domain-containing protein n=1 Tax=Panicum hallii var. hallii TaxID=1504633 RepID=A0A2T7EKC0_9POAL|nr:hypothetical protein GQ55_2G013300 [Panicum hallii var. hallii]